MEKLWIMVIVIQIFAIFLILADGGIKTKTIDEHEYIVYRSTIIHSAGCDNKAHLGYL